MKINSITKGLATVCLIFVGTILHGQKVVETSFKVSGVCHMCEDRIEKAVDIKGVKMADYDLDSQILSIAFNTQKISEEEIHTLLNKVGHDTEKSKASKEQYNSIHGCCKYREHENH